MYSSTVSSALYSLCFHPNTTCCVYCLVNVQSCGHLKLFMYNLNSFLLQCVPLYTKQLQVSHSLLITSCHELNVTADSIPYVLHLLRKVWFAATCLRIEKRHNRVGLNLSILWQFVAWNTKALALTHTRAHTRTHAHTHTQCVTIYYVLCALYVYTTVNKPRSYIYIQWFRSS